MFTYNWDSYPKVKTFLIDIFNNSKENINIEYVRDFFNDIEEFLYYLKIKGYDINRIITKLCNVKGVGFFNENDGSNKTPVVTFSNKILLNHNLKDDRRLTTKERRRLYLYQALLRNILSLRNDKTKEFSKIYSAYLDKDAKRVEILVNNGWLLLEETLSQDIAERITYDTLGKQRPSIRPGLENETLLVDERKIDSNLENYRVFHNILIAFGLTLSDVGSIYNYSREIIGYDLMKKALKNDLSDSIINEYLSKDRQIELFELLYLMGLLINEKYDEYRLSFINKYHLTEKEINKIYDTIDNLTMSLFNLKTDAQYEDMPIQKDEGNIFTKKRVLDITTNN